MPSLATALSVEVPTVPPPAPPVVPPAPPPEVVPTIPTFLWSKLMLVVEWWNLLSTLQKVLVIAGVSGSVVTVVGLSRRKKEEEVE